MPSPPSASPGRRSESESRRRPPSATRRPVLQSASASAPAIAGSPPGVASAIAPRSRRNSGGRSASARQRSRSGRPLSEFAALRDSEQDSPSGSSAPSSARVSARRDEPAEPAKVKSPVTSTRSAFGTPARPEAFSLVEIPEEELNNAGIQSPFCIGPDEAEPEQLSLEEARYAADVALLLQWTDEQVVSAKQPSAATSELQHSLSGRGAAKPPLSGIASKRRAKLEEVVKRRLRSLRLLSEQQSRLGKQMQQQQDELSAQREEASSRLQQHQIAAAEDLFGADALSGSVGGIQSARLDRAEAQVADVEQRCVHEARARQNELDTRQAEVDECMRAACETEALFAEQEREIVAMADQSNEVEAEQLQKDAIELEQRRLEVEVREVSLRCMETVWHKASAEWKQRAPFAMEGGRSAVLDVLCGDAAEKIATDLIQNEPYMQLLRELVRVVSLNTGIEGSPMSSARGTLSTNGVAGREHESARPEELAVEWENGSGGSIADVETADPGDDARDPTDEGESSASADMNAATAPASFVPSGREPLLDGRTPTSAQHALSSSSTPRISPRRSRLVLSPTRRTPVPSSSSTALWNPVMARGLTASTSQLPQGCGQWATKGQWAVGNQRAAFGASFELSSTLGARAVGTSSASASASRLPPGGRTPQASPPMRDRVIDWRGMVQTAAIVSPTRSFVMPPPPSSVVGPSTSMPGTANPSAGSSLMTIPHTSNTPVAPGFHNFTPNASAGSSLIAMPPTSNTPLAQGPSGQPPRSRPAPAPSPRVVAGSAAHTVPAYAQTPTAPAMRQPSVSPAATPIGSPVVMSSVIRYGGGVGQTWQPRRF